MTMAGVPNQDNLIAIIIIFYICKNIYHTYIQTHLETSHQEHGWQEE